MGERVTRYRKLLVAAAGVIAQIINLNLVAGSLRDWLIVALAALTALGVYRVPNAAPGASAATTAPTAANGTDAHDIR